MMLSKGFPRGHSGWSLANRVTVAANCFHGLTSATNIHLFQNSMDVVSHREFREIQLSGDLFVGQTFGDEGDQLLLSQSEIRSRGRAFDRALFDYMSNEAE